MAGEREPYPQGSERLLVGRSFQSLWPGLVVNCVYLINHATISNFIQ